MILENLSNLIYFINTKLNILKLVYLLIISEQLLFVCVDHYEAQTY